MTDLIPQVQVSAAGALRSLAQSNSVSQGRIAELGGINPLIRLLKSNPRNLDVSNSHTSLFISYLFLLYLFISLLVIFVMFYLPVIYYKAATSNLGGISVQFYALTCCIRSISISLISSLVD